MGDGRSACPVATKHVPTGQFDLLNSWSWSCKNTTKKGCKKTILVLLGRWTGLVGCVFRACTGFWH